MKPRPKRRRPRVAIPVVAMGDVAFLLVIFFMLAQNIQKDTGLSLTPPRSLDLDELAKSRITVAVEKDGLIKLQGNVLGSPQALQGALDLLLKDAATPEARTVWFRCDKDVPREVFEPVLSVISESGGIIAAIGDEGTPPLKENR